MKNNDADIVSSLIVAVGFIFLLAVLLVGAYFIGSRMKGDGISNICPYMISPVMVGFCLTQQQK